MLRRINSLSERTQVLSVMNAWSSYRTSPAPAGSQGPFSAHGRALSSCARRHLTGSCPSGEAFSHWQDRHKHAACGQYFWQFCQMSWNSMSEGSSCANLTVKSSEKGAWVSRTNKYLYISLLAQQKHCLSSYSHSSRDKLILANRDNKLIYTLKSFIPRLPNWNALKTKKKCLAKWEGRFNKWYSNDINKITRYCNTD